MDASIWDQILTRIETKVNRHSFFTWFKPTSFVADAGHTITVRVPNILFKDWLTKHYSLVLNEALAEVRRPGVSLLFVAEGVPLPVVAPTQYRDSGGVTCCSGAAFDPAFGACARPDTPKEIAIAGTAATITARDVRMCISFR